MMQSTNAHKVKLSRMLLSNGLLIAIFAVCSVLSQASDAQPNTDSVSSLDYANMSFDELLQVKVTSATLTDESLKTVPASVTVFTRAQIRQLGVRTLEELMNYVPGYQSYRNDTGNNSYASRSRRSASNNREVLQLLDGQRLNEDLLGSDLVAHVSLENIERVEFIRGPGSAIYGANAFLGVINIVTASDLNEVSLSGGSHQEQANINLSGQLENGLKNSLFAQVNRSNGEQQTLYDPITESFKDSRQGEITNSIYWRANWGDWSAQARHSEYHSNDGYAVGTVDDDYNRNELDANFLALTYQHEFNVHWKFDTRLFRSSYLLNNNFRSVNVPVVISGFNQHGTSSGIESHLQWHDGSADALLGVSYTQNDINYADFNVWLPPATPAEPMDSLETSTRSFTGVFAQWKDAFPHREWGNKLSYILGVRYDAYSDVNGYTSPRLGLIWQMDTNNTLKLLYGEAFRAPTRSDVGIKNNTFILGNPNLKPEISKTTELVWMHSSNQHYLSSSLFVTTIEDAIEITNTVPPRTFINGATQSMSGFEMEWHWQFSEGWQLRSNVSHLFKSPLTPNDDATDLASSSVVYATGKFTTNLSARYHGERRDADTSLAGYHELNSYTLLDAHIDYRFATAWTAYGNVRNLMNKAYTQPASQNANNLYGVPGLGRELELGIRWNFE